MRYTFKAALFAALSFTAAPAFAQEADIVVTATRGPTEASRLPARIEVIDRDDMETRGLTTLVDAIGAQAVQSSGAGQQASVFLRGTNSKHVLALLDGIRLNDASSPTSAYDFGQDTLGALERVEVLRGPASTIYGSDAVGGVVNMIPRIGGDTAFEPFLEAEAGSFETLRTLLGAAGSGGGFTYGVSTEFYDTAGFDTVPERFPLHSGDEDGSTITTATGAARRQSGAWAFDVLARYRWAESEYDTLGGGPGFDQRADDPDIGNEQEQTVWRLGGDYAVNDVLNLRLSGGQVSLDRAEQDGGFQTFSAAFDRDFADLTAHYGFGGGSLTGGLSFENNALDNVSQFNDPLAIDENQSAAYVIGQFDIDANVVATGSVRVDEYEAFGAHTTYALGAVATFDRLRLFGSYGTAFKAPSLSERYETGFFNIGNPDLEPEESTSWEIGWDYDVSDAITMGASYYHTRIDNMIDYVFAQVQNVNIDEADIDGAEIYVEVAPASWADLRLSYAWTDAHDEAIGEQLSRRPENDWTVEARFAPTDRLGVALTWDYVGARNDTVYDATGVFLGAGEVESYSVGRANVTLDLDERTQLFVRIDNITDETYEPVEAYAGAPRSAFVGVRARF
jgi:vitamin B12 transporter